MLVKCKNRAQNREGFRDTCPAGAPKMPTAQSRACLRGRVPEDLEPPAGPPAPVGGRQGSPGQPSRRANPQPQAPSCLAARTRETETPTSQARGAGRARTRHGTAVTWGS